MTKQLDQQQLMDIAKELVSKPEEKMPDYLTKAEEETVKELVKILRASNLAMKTYVQAKNYNDALRKQIEIESDLKEQLERQIRAKADYSGKWTLLMRLTKRMKRNLQMLEDNEIEAAERLQRTIDIQRNKVVELFIRHGIPPGSKLFREGKEARMNESLYLFLNQSFFGKDFTSLKDEDALVAAQRKLTSLRDNLKKTNPGLASAAEAMSQKMYDAENELLEVYNLPSADAHHALGARVKFATKELQNAGRAVGELTAQLEKQQPLTEQQRQITLAMGKWYIVAAMAETFIELGQNLAY
jgi:hypothetical protein